MSRAVRRGWRRRRDLRDRRAALLRLHGAPDRAGARAPVRRAAGGGHRSRAALQASLRRACRFSTSALLNLDVPSEEVIAQDKKRLVVDAFARWRIVDPLRFYQALYDQNTRDHAADADPVFQRAPRARLAELRRRAVEQARAAHARHPRQRECQDTQNFGIRIVDVRIRHADLPPRTARRSTRACRRNASARRANTAPRARKSPSAYAPAPSAKCTVLIAEATRESEILRGQGDAEKTRILADAYSQDPDFFAFYRSMQAYQDALQGDNTTLVLSPNSEFFKYFGSGGAAISKGKR